jgi:hypothetical protein
MSLAWRIAIGSTILAVLAIADLRQRGRDARRWREYLFLLCVMVLAMAYGAINDQITSRISWEYFYYGKDLSKVLGPETPPDPAALHWQAMKVGVEATWSAGLLMGMALLLANNPSPGLRQLSGPRLLSTLVIVVAVVIPLAAIGGGRDRAGFSTGCRRTFLSWSEVGCFVRITSSVLTAFISGDTSVRLWERYLPCSLCGAGGMKTHRATLILSPGDISANQN